MSRKDEQQELARLRAEAAKVPTQERAPEPASTAAPADAAPKLPPLEMTPEELAKAQSFVETVDVTDVDFAAVIAEAADAPLPGSTDALLAEIAELRAQLADSENKRTEAQEAALAAAKAQGMLMQREIEEIPTGKMVTVMRLNPAKPYKVVGHHDDGREILKPMFVPVQRPTFYYKIDLPPQGGEHIVLNGAHIYHGAVVELDIDTLRSVKDIVYRGWKHDRDIHKSDENIYRKDSAWQRRNAGVHA